MVTTNPDDLSAHPARPTRTRWLIVAAISLVAIGLAARWPLLPYPGFLHDQDQFIEWAHVAATRGLTHVYDRFDRNGRPTPLCNYPPLQVYMCRTLATIYPFVTGKPLDEAAVHSIEQRDDTPPVRAAYASRLRYRGSLY
jgi:hypothetical protein